VFVDRKIQWSAGVYQTFQVQKISVQSSALAAAAWVVGDIVCQPGVHFSLCALPLNSLCATTTATINDTTTVMNTQDVLKEVLRLTDYKKNRLVRTAPTMLDKYAQYADANGANNNPLGAYGNASEYDNVPNGAFPQLAFTNAVGALATAATTYTSNGGTVAFASAGLLPVVSALPSPTTAPLDVYVFWSSTEPVVLSPFIFADEREWTTGLFGLNNIQLICNLLPASQLRNIRSNPAAGGYNVVAAASDSAFRYIVPGSLQFNQSVPTGVFSVPKLNVQFLTPSLDVPLPPKSVVPYFEFPRYISQTTSSPLAPGASTQIQSQTINMCGCAA